MRSVLRVTLALLAVLSATNLSAGPFCGVRETTFVEEYEGARVAMIVVETDPPKLTKFKIDEDDEDSKVDLHRYRVVEVVKGGNQLVKVGDELDLLPPLFPARAGTKLWYTQGQSSYFLPVPLNEATLSYVQSLAKLPKSGTRRLAFFQAQLSSRSEQIAREAFKHLGHASHEELQEFKPQLDRDFLAKQLQNRDLWWESKRACLKLLAYCGTESDAAAIEKKLVARDDESLNDLGGLIPTYLALKGAGGLDIVDQYYLKRRDTKPSEVFVVVMALRDTEKFNTQLPRGRLIRSYRLVLDRNDAADMVVMDLAAMEDWGSMEQVAKLFKTQEFARSPVVRYLKACPKPEAKAHLKEFEKLDPELFRRLEQIAPPAKVKSEA